MRALDLAQADPHWQELDPGLGPGQMLPVAGVRDALIYDTKSDRWRKAGNVVFSLGDDPVVFWKDSAVLINGEVRPAGEDAQYLVAANALRPWSTGCLVAGARLTFSVKPPGGYFSWNVHGCGITPAYVNRV